MKNPIVISRISNDVQKPLATYTFDEAQSIQKEAVWRNLANISVEQAIEEWLKILGNLTAKNYASGIKILSEHNLIHLDITLQAFALINHDAIIDRIKNLSILSESSKQARAACYIAFTRFLSRRTESLIRKAIPSREGNKTFFRVREKVHTQAMTRAQWITFLENLHKLNQRDCLIAKITLQGGKRISEVLSLRTEQINYSVNEVTFRQSKTKGYEKATVITYPSAVIGELRSYLDNREGIVFVTKYGQPVMPNQLAITFEKAGIKAGIPFKVTPHVLRASAVTYLKGQGFTDSDIMKVTGHASSEMIHAYDKSERAQNASKKINLV